MSQVFYRKWRPQTLADVVGQEPVTRTLANALSQGRVAHAYLFAGPRGTGKTSTGRILAKAVNCLENGRGEPCNSCRHCREITEGRSLDLLEVDAASNRGIDEVRELREKARYAPASCRFKVYIIDEVHQLTPDAANALLKTLEEPPAHVIFVLATTEPHKVPPTILSRCQRFEFRRLSLAAIKERLAYVCQQEGIQAEPAALHLTARAASGSLRDAENILEQLSLSLGTVLPLVQVQKALGFEEELPAAELARYVLSRDLPRGLALINRLQEEGQDLRQLHRRLMDYLRGLLLLRAGAEGALEATPEALAEMKALAASASLQEISRAVRSFGEINLRLDSSSPLPLELALVECALAQGGHPAGPKQMGETAPEEPVARREAPSRPPQRQQGPPEPPPAARERPEVVDLDYLKASWKSLVGGAFRKAGLDALLRQACEPVALAGETLTLRFYYPFHKEKVEEPNNLRQVEEVLRRELGTPLKVHCILEPRKPQPQANSILDEALKMGARLVERSEQ